MNLENIAASYDEYYYTYGCGKIPYGQGSEWLQLFGGIADVIVRDIHPGTVLDAGCAMGLLVHALRQRHVAAYGVDLSEYAVQRVPEPAKAYCWVGSVAEAFSQRYDLIVCIEILEHLPPRDSERAVENLCRHTDDILFSSTPFDYTEPTHFNVQPPEAWAELFARHGFFREVDFDASFINPWAARFRRRADPLQSIVRDYERKFWMLAKENTDLRKAVIEMRDQLAADARRIEQSEQQAKQLQVERDLMAHSFTWRTRRALMRLLGRPVSEV
jgi:SAM-dependent methyltransferase